MEEGKSCRSSNGNVIFIIGVVGVVIFFVIVVNIVVDVAVVIVVIGPVAIIVLVGIFFFNDAFFINPFGKSSK